jgi:hypothetical protein
MFNPHHSKTGNGDFRFDFIDSKANALVDKRHLILPHSINVAAGWTRRRPTGPLKPSFFFQPVCDNREAAGLLTPAALRVCREIVIYKRGQIKGDTLRRLQQNNLDVIFYL